MVKTVCLYDMTFTTIKKIIIKKYKYLKPLGLSRNVGQESLISEMTAQSAASCLILKMILRIHNAVFWMEAGFFCFRAPLSGLTSVETVMILEERHEIKLFCFAEKKKATWPQIHHKHTGSGRNSSKR